MNNIYSTGEVAKRIGIQPYRITYAITSGAISDASYRFLGKRCFSEKDIERIAAYFGVTSMIDDDRRTA
jgi:DNA-binding transcriptional MerR regulator